jgi:hypothetical protein
VSVKPTAEEIRQAEQTIFRVYNRDYLISSSKTVAQEAYELAVKLASEKKAPKSIYV